MKLLVILFALTFIVGCASKPGADLPNHTTFRSHGTEEIQSMLISAYLGANQGWSIKDQTANTVTFTKVQDGAKGILTQALVSGGSGSLPIIESQFSFANRNGVTNVYPTVRMINTNGFGKQTISVVENPSGAKETLHAVRKYMEPDNL